MYGVLFLQQRTDTPCNEPRLHLRAVEHLLVGVFHINQMKLGLRVRARQIVRRPEMQFFLLAVVHLAHLSGHDVGKHEVGRVEHFLARAEVLRQQHLARFSLLRLFGIAVVQILLQKDGRVSQAEPVNALLYIAHRKEVLLLLGNGTEDTVLHFVGVLILVHHDFPVASGDLSGQVGGRAVFLCQNRNGVVLLVGEINHITAHLFLLIGLGKRLCQPDQRQHSRRHHAKILQIFFR